MASSSPPADGAPPVAPSQGVAVPAHAPPQPEATAATATNGVSDPNSGTQAAAEDAVTPSQRRDTTLGTGRAGPEAVQDAQAKPVVLGGGGEEQETVVGEARGAHPEWIAKVRKVRTASKEGDLAAKGDAQEEEELVRGPEGDKGAPAIQVAEPNGASSGASLSTQGRSTCGVSNGTEDSSDDKSGPKWLRKVKGAAASVKDKATGGNSSAKSERTNSYPPEEQAPLVGPDGAAAPAAAPAPGSKSQVAFSEAAPTVSRPAPPERHVTDRDGTPIPLNLGADAPPDTSSDVTGGGGGGGGAAGAKSMSKSVKDKVLETHEVEPRISDEKFRGLFSNMPDEEALIEVYNCALSRDVLIQGKIYVSEHYLSFRANLLGWETTLSLPWTEIVAIEKKSIATVIPNAIEVRTLHATHVFASFLNRDASYDLIVTVWRYIHPEADAVAATAASRSLIPPDSGAEKVQSSGASTASAPVGTPRPKWVVGHDVSSTPGTPKADAKSEITYEDEHGHKKRHRFRSGLRSLGLTRKHRSSSSSTGSSNEPTEAEKVKARAKAAEEAPEGTHPPTTYDGPEYEHVALDCVLPTTPLKAFKLFFVDKPFLTKFMTEKEGLKELEIGPWKAIDGSEAEQDALAAAKEREITYLKPLNAPVGPKQTHCIIHDINEHFDEEGYFAVKTVTKSPDVPSGNDFVAVNRSIFTWAAGGGCHVRVTTEVEWTKVNRFLRGPIERGTVEGIESYHSDLEEVVREHIKANPEEYKVPGVSDNGGGDDSGVKSADMAPKDPKRKSKRSSSGGSGLLDMLPEVSLTVALLSVLLVVLFITNMFTLHAMRRQARLARQAELGKPDAVASAIGRVLDDFNALHLHGHHASTKESVHAHPVPQAKETVHAAPASEAAELRRTLHGLERTLTASVGELQAAIERAHEIAERVSVIKRVP